MALKRSFLVFAREKCQLLCNTHIPLSEACNMKFLEIHENAEWHFYVNKEVSVLLQLLNDLMMNVILKFLLGSTTIWVIYTFSFL